MQGFERRLPTFHVYPASNPANTINKIPPSINAATIWCANADLFIQSIGFPSFAADSVMLPTSFPNQSYNKFVQPRYLTSQKFLGFTNHSPAGRAMLPKPFPPPTTNTYTVKKKPKSVKTCISGCGFGDLENEAFVIFRSEKDYFPHTNDDGSHSWHLGREQPRFYRTKRHCVESRNPAFVCESLLPVDAGIITDTLRETMLLEFGLIV